MKDEEEDYARKQQRADEAAFLFFKVAVVVLGLCAAYSIFYSIFFG